MSEFKFPSETVELPSRGLVYPESNPLSSGTVEMKYMTAKEEDILTNQNYIKDGTVLDRLLKSLILSKINYEDLIVGDKNAIMVAARILGYGKDYTFKYEGEEVTVDLTTLDSRYIDESNIIEKGVNKFKFKMPSSEIEVDEEKKSIREYVDNYCLARDSRALREYVKSFQPDIDLLFNFESNDGIEKELSLPMTVTFFWPDATV